MIYAKQCPHCGSKKIGGAVDELKQCLSCGALWFEPIPDSPQQRFLQSSVKEVGFGGEAGGSKSFSLILDPTYQLTQKDYHALLLRRTYKQLTGDDGLVSLSQKVYPALGGTFIKSEYLWTFSDYPGTIRFGHIEHENNLEQDHEGHQYAYLGWDELQTFTERMYLYLFSRNRSSNPDIKLYIRSTFMPGGIGHFWVKKRFIDPFKNGRGYINQPKFFRRINGIDTEVESGDKYATQRLFIPSRLEDNPYLYQDGEGEYEKGLYQLDTVDYRRKRGDWDIRRTGRVYHAFTGPGPDASTLDYSKAAGYWHSHDFGAVNAVWGLWCKIGDVYFLIHEQQLPEGTTASRAAIIKARLDGLNVVAGYGGAKGEDQQRLDYGKEGVNIRLPRITDVEGQIDAANRMLENGTMVICSNCVHTIDQMENCVRDEKEGIAEKSTWHYCDMTRYFAAGVSQPQFTIGDF